jgi:predicted nucleotidyltransferase
MTTSELIRKKRAEILRIAASHGAHRVRLFGSVARGEERPDSDVDFLVEMEDGRSLLDLGELVMDLQDLLGKSVDVVEPDGLHWYIRDRVLSEAAPV